MKSCAFVLSMALVVALAAGAQAQCQRGGGSPGTSTSTGTITAGVPLIGSAETSYQAMRRAYAQEMQRAYVLQMQRAYFQQVHEQQEAIAQDKEDKRQQRIAVWREHRQAELERREAAKARNLARRNSDRSLASN